jgi:hypothetical protein
MPEIHECEYRFDLVLDAERENCLNWELYRELCRCAENKLPKPWLKLNPNEKAKFRECCFIDLLQKKLPIWPVPPIFGQKEDVDSQTGEKFVSPEVVPINFELLIQWDQSDSQLLEGINEFFAEWLERQRNTNANARHFKKKPERGRRKNVVQWLARLAVWRLHKLGGLNDQEIEVKLRELLRVLKVHGLSGNLSRWCTDIEKILRK